MLIVDNHGVNSDLVVGDGDVEESVYQVEDETDRVDKQQDVVADYEAIMQHANTTTIEEECDLVHFLEAE